MDDNILKFVWRYSRSQQLVVVGLTVISFPLLYLSLELPKWIINNALSEPVIQRNFFGFEVAPVPYLVILCVLLLTLVVANGALKMRVNTYKGIIGERLVRRLRFQLIDRILKFPLRAFSRVSSGELISTVTSETEPLAGYIGESIALPLFQGGTMLTILLFMFMQDWVFGLVSVALIPVQGYLIPKLQKQVNVLKKERVRRVRKLSERIGETVSGATEIRLHGTEPYTLAEFSKRLGDLFYVRLDIFRKKFFMKFLNNTIGQITPFLFYLFGGYLVIQGDLTIGALVAAIGAYKDLTSPWRELLNHYQNHEDAKIKYQQIVEQFSPDGILEDTVLSTSSAGIAEGGMSASNLSLSNDSGEAVLSRVSFAIKPGQMIAIVGDYSVRRARLAEILAGISQPDAGRVFLGATGELQHNWVALQGPNPHMFSGSISDNVIYGLNQSPPDVSEEDTAVDWQREARASGNSENPHNGDWKDYGRIGLTDRKSLREWYLKTAHCIEADTIMYERSMFEVFDPSDRSELSQDLLKVRKLIRKELVKRGLTLLVTRFDPDTYNPYASVGENILFGVADDAKLAARRDVARMHLDKIFGRLGILNQALEIGLQVAQKLVDQYREVGTSSRLLTEFKLDDEDRMEAVAEIVDGTNKLDNLSPDERSVLRSLFLRIIPAQHHFVSIDSRLTTKLIQARRDFSEMLPEELMDVFVPFDDEKYHPVLAVKDNLLFGRLSSHDPESERTVNDLVSDCIDKIGVRADLIMLLAESQVGINGSRLPEVARHRISLGRILLKRPKVIIFHDALAPFDTSTQTRLRKNVTRLLPETSIVWISRDVPDVEEFDQVLEFSPEGSLVVRYSARHVEDDLGDVKTTADRGSESVSRKAEAGDIDEKDPFALISCSRMFRGLTPVQQQFLADHSRTLTISASKKLYHVGDDADSVYLVVQGEVVSTRANGSVMGRLGRLEVFGMLETLVGRPRGLTANIETDAVLLRIDAEALHDVADGDNAVLKNLLRAMSDQVMGVTDERDAA